MWKESCVCVFTSLENAFTNVQNTNEMIKHFNPDDNIRIVHALSPRSVLVE